MSRARLEPGDLGKVRYKAREDGKVDARAYFRDMSGKRREVQGTGPDEAAALRALLDNFSEKIHATEGQAIKPTTTVRELATMWVDRVDAGTDPLAKTNKPRAPRTRERYRSIVENYVVPRLGDLQLRECKPSQLQWHVTAIAREVGQATAILCRTTMAGMFEVARLDDAIEVNPADRLRLPDAPVKPTPKALAPEEIRAFLAKLYDDERVQKSRRRTDLYDVVALLAGTGVRIGEALALRWEDLDLAPAGDAAPSVLIHATTIRLKGEHVKIQPHTKTKDVKRLALPRWLVAVLLERQTMNRAVPTEEGLVFPSKWSTVRDSDALRRQLREACKRIGVDGVTPHTFRRTTATVIERTEGVQGAADQLGHTDVAMTLRHYVEKRPQDIDHRDALEALGPLGGDAA